MFPVTTPSPAEQERDVSVAELQEAWEVLSAAERLEGWSLLSHEDAADFLLSLRTHEQTALFLSMPATQRRTWMRLLPPDDAADVIQDAPIEERESLLSLLDEQSRREVSALLAYAEDDAGGLMNPRFARLRPESRIDEAITYLRRQAREHLETIYYVYVLDPEQRLLGVVSFRELLLAPPSQTVHDIMHTEVVTAHESMDQEELSQLFTEHHFIAIPVVDDERRVKGIVTVDDIVHVVQEEATEDIQKIGGMEALEQPYLTTGVGHMIRKRGGWLSILLIGEMLTATAMGYFEHQITRAVVLTLFVPLIISSGGNSGSQATTLVIRAMALDEVTLRDWWRVMQREILSGVGLGILLGTIGFLRIVVWEGMFAPYGEHYLLIAITVAVSLAGVVLWGTIAGSMLPFVMRRFGFDPASASAPFVATLVDVSGLIIYFSVASVVLAGTLL